MRVFLAVAGVLAVGVLSGCAAASGEVRFADEVPASRTPFTGSLVATPTDAQKARPSEWPGAAGRVVECSSPPHGQTVIGENTEGAVASDPRAAVEVKMGEGLFLDSPTDALVLERDDGDRVLFTTSYDGIARQALIVRDGPSSPGSGAKDGHGWFVESFAACDLADFPESVSASRGVEVWSDRDGIRVPTTTVVSASGPEHCDWQSMTFLTLGDRSADAETYVAHPSADLDGYFDEPFQEHVPVPGDARSTGFERDGRRLWLSSDGDYAYVGSQHDAEAWPRPAKDFGCA